MDAYLIAYALITNSTQLSQNPVKHLFNDKELEELKKLQLDDSYLNSSNCLKCVYDISFVTSKLTILFLLHPNKRRIR